MKQFTHMLTIADVCCESIKAWHFLAKSSLFIWPKMTLGKVILWLFATSLMASFSMESTNDHWKHFRMGVGNRGFQNCSSYKNCFTTTRRSKLQDPHIVINAIVFHGVGMNMKEIKNLREVRAKLSEFNQGIDPLFILFLLESPKGGVKGANLNNPLLQDFFNVTYTYRTSADLYMPIGTFVPKNSKSLDGIIGQT